eukprot:12202735-Alexandrium_andersonii.AAC.1
MTPNPPDEALQGGDLRPFLGPRSSSSERVEHFCRFRKLCGAVPSNVDRRLTYNSKCTTAQQAVCSSFEQFPA